MVQQKPTPPHLRHDIHIRDMLTDLVAAYEQPEFQDELGAAQATDGFDVALMGKIVAHVQYPVLSKHGFEPSPEGVNQMKQSVAHALVRGVSQQIRENADKVLWFAPAII